MKGSTEGGSDENPSNYEFQSVQEKLSSVENQMESQKNEIVSLNGLIRQDKVHYKLTFGEFWKEKLDETEQELQEYKNKLQSLQQYTDNLEAKLGIGSPQNNDKTLKFNETEG